MITRFYCIHYSLRFPASVFERTHNTIIVFFSTMPMHRNKRNNSYLLSTMPKIQISIPFCWPTHNDKVLHRNEIYFTYTNTLFQRSIQICYVQLNNGSGNIEIWFIAITMLSNA